MAKMEFPISEEFITSIGNAALDEFMYKGHSIREWADKITSSECRPDIHGWWCPESARDECGRIVYHCSECDFEVKVLPYNIVKWRTNEKYCAGCGARMDGDSDEKRH